MLDFPRDLSKARILVTNDDGIHSHGIKVLEECLRDFTDDVVVVAPEHEQSAASHSLTIHTPLRIRKYDDSHYSVFGTPTDCVLLAVRHILKDNPPHLVVSGINHGRNTGDDITYSGTVAGAIEGTLLGLPAIAFSQEYRSEEGGPDWNVARDWLPRILQKLEGQSWPDNILLNVNFPRVAPASVAGIRVVQHGHYAGRENIVEATDPRGRNYYWIGPPPRIEKPDAATDLGVLAAGGITITPLSLNLTHRPTLETLGKVFS